MNIVYVCRERASYKCMVVLMLLVCTVRRLSFLSPGLWFFDRKKAICSYDQNPRFKLDWAIEADPE